MTEVNRDERDKDFQLFRKLNDYMHAEKLFVDPTINRKRLADCMHTNEMYLANAIRRANGMTFSAYLSNMRLNYALCLMNEYPDMNVDDIVVDSGYRSYSKFFRSFTKKYGISPIEYRKLSTTK